MDAKKGMLSFSNLLMVGKSTTHFEGNTYYKAQFSNGVTVSEIKLDEDSYQLLQPFHSYSGSCDYINGKLKIVSLIEDKGNK